MKSTLLKKTLDLLLKDKGNWPETANQTGLKYDWISALSQGGIEDPGVKKIERLYEYLRKKYPSEESVAEAS